MPSFHTTESVGAVAFRALAVRVTVLLSHGLDYPRYGRRLLFLSDRAPLGAWRATLHARYRVQRTRRTIVPTQHVDAVQPARTASNTPTSPQALPGKFRCRIDNRTLALATCPAQGALVYSQPPRIWYSTGQTE